MMRAEYESARRDYPNNGGTLVWMLHDCWPTANWSIVDYSGTPKPAYYAAKRSCRPILPILFERSGMLQLFVSNLTPQALKYRVKYGLRKLDGLRSWEKETIVQVAPYAAAMFHEFPLQKTACCADEYFYIEDVHETAAYFPNGWRDVPWPEPALTLEIRQGREAKGRWQYTTEIHAQRYARLVHLHCPKKSAALFSDNYFDLPAQSSKQIEIVSDIPLRADEIEIGHWLTPWY